MLRSVPTANYFLALLVIHVGGCATPTMPPDPLAVSWVTGANVACPPSTGDTEAERDSFYGLDLETATLTEALGALERTTEFGTDRTGFGLVWSRGLIVLDAVLREPDAKEHLERLWTQGTPAAQLYAVVGFYAIDPARFDETARSIASRRECVVYLDYCIAVELPMPAAFKEASRMGLLERVRGRIYKPAG